MNVEILRRLASSGTIDQGTVVVVTGRLAVESESGEILECDVLSGALTPGREFAVGDRVLVVRLHSEENRGCVLGIIEEYSEPVMVEEAPRETTTRKTISAEEIVIEAGRRLELKVNDNTIVITEDGRIVIRGKNILSRAKELNKIKGAAVGIN